MHAHADGSAPVVLGGRGTAVGAFDDVRFVLLALYFNRTCADRRAPDRLVIQRPTVARPHPRRRARHAGARDPGTLIAAGFSGDSLLAHWTQTFMGAAA